VEREGEREGGWWDERLCVRERYRGRKEEGE